MTDYRCVPCDDLALWDSLVEKSPQGNLFCTSALLSALDDVRFDPWLVLRNDQPEAGAVVLCKGDGRVGVGYHLCPYLGVMMASHVSGLPVQRRTRWTLETLNCLISSLTARYLCLRFAFHPDFEDLRPFQWHNYHLPAEGKFRIILRYTGLIDFNGLDNFAAYICSLPESRRNQYRKALSRGYRVVESNDVEKLIDLHLQTFSNQGASCTANEVSAIRNVANVAVNKGIGLILACVNPEGKIANMALFMCDWRWGYYVTGGSDAKYRGQLSGVLLHIEYVRLAMESGLQAVDMIGMNSPSRGEFKTSLNAQLRPYFVAEWNKAENGS